MNVAYIYHSGFLVETGTCYYLFDYYRGKLPSLAPDKPVIVLSSHSHPDHYNPQVFSILRKAGAEQITAVLSDDITPDSVPEDIPVVMVQSGKEYHLPGGLQLRTLRSTDLGVAFLLKDPEGVIYHAGDLNDWVWEEETPSYNEEMTSNYRHEIDKLAGTSIQTAFLPLDPRQGPDYARGILYFLNKVKPEKVYPMHYWEKPEIIDRFRQEYPQFAEILVPAPK